MIDLVNSLRYNETPEMDDVLGLAWLRTSSNFVSKSLVFVGWTTNRSRLLTLLQSVSVKDPLRAR